MSMNPTYQAPIPGPAQIQGPQQTQDPAKSKLLEKYYIFEVDRPVIKKTKDPKFEQLKEVCESDVALADLPICSSDTRPISFHRLSSIFMQLMSLEGGSPLQVDSLIDFVDTSCSKAEQNFLFSLVKRQRIGRSDKTLYYTKKGLRTLLALDFSYLKTYQSYRKMILLKYFSHTLDQQALRIGSSIKLPASRKKALFVDYFFADYIEARSHIMPKSELTRRLVREVFSQTKLRRKAEESRIIKGVSNVSYLTNLLRKSHRLRSHMLAFLEHDHIPLVVQNYQAGLDNYLSSIVQKINYYVKCQKYEYREEETRFMSLEEEEEHRKMLLKKEPFSGEKYKDLILWECKNIQTSGYFKFPWALEEHQQARAYLMNLVAK